MMSLAELFTMLPEVALLGAIIIVMIFGLFSTKRRQVGISYWLSQLSLLTITFLVWQQIDTPTSYALHNMFILDSQATLAKVLLLISSIFGLAYAKPLFNEEPKIALDFCLLYLFAVLGMLTMVSSNNLIPLYLGLELMSLPIYALVAIRHNGDGTEAAMKYFALGALASAMLLYGFSMMYGLTGSLGLAEIANKIAHLPAGYNLLAILGLVFIAGGMAFKFGAAPFHQWTPDVYQGAPTAVTAFIGSAPKIAVLIMAYRLFGEALINLSHQWQELWIFLAIASMALGNIAAIIQNNLRRMLAYSAVAHMGYMALGFLSNSPAGFAASMFYVFSYALMTLAAFGALIVTSNQGFAVETFEDLRGLNSRNPWVAFMILIIMFSMAGIPPSIGFFAKMGVLEALIGVHLTWLAVLALVFSIIGAYYYLRVVKSMYFEAVEESAPLYTSLNGKIILSVNSLLILILGILPSSLIDLCRNVYVH